MTMNRNESIGPGTRRLPVRFYLIAVLFILFDIETIFFLPWAIVFRQLGLFGLIEMAVFITSYWWVISTHGKKEPGMD